MSHFAFLQTEWHALHEAAVKGEGLVNGDACVTHVYPLEEFREAMTRKPGPEEVQIKVMLDPRL